MSPSGSGYWTPVEEALARIDRAPKRPRKVLILGAGLGGMVSAYELKKRGVEVEIIEASDRAGGRIWTWRPEGPDGPCHEFGGMRIPVERHDYTMHYIRLLGLPMRRFVNANPDAFYNVDGDVFHIKDRREIPRIFAGVTDGEKVILSAPGPKGGPSGLLGTIMQPLIEELTPPQKRNLVNGNLDDPRLRELDGVSVRGHLLAVHRDGGLSAAAVACLGATLALESRWNWSLAVDLRGSLTNNPAPGHMHEIVGGMDRLCDGMRDKLAELGVTPRYETPVEAIHVDDAGGVEVRVRGKSAPLTADRVLCTLPFPVLRKLRLTGLSADKMRSIRNFQYASSTKVMLLCKERFWERNRPDGPRILGGVSLSNRLSRSTYYPSDFAGNAPWDPRNPPPEMEAAGLEGVAVEDSYWTVNLHDEEPPPAEMLEATTEEDTRRKGVLLGSYSWSDNSRQVGRLEGSHASPSSAEGELSARAELVRRDLEHIHPELTPDMVDKTASIFWDTFPWAGGAFALGPPGDLSAYYRAGRRAEGNLFFAGEHVSIAPGWIQGAFESSLAATARMLGGSDDD